MSATWPDPARPGVPMNPEREGAHWLKGCTEDACMWQDEGWYIPGYSHKLDAETVASRYSYLGPALMPAEVDARIATARKDAWEKAVRAVNEIWKKFMQPLPDEEYIYPDATDLPTGPTYEAAIRALAKGEGDE